MAHTPNSDFSKSRRQHQRSGICGQPLAHSMQTVGIHPSVIAVVRVFAIIITSWVHRYVVSFDIGSLTNG